MKEQGITLQRILEKVAQYYNISEKQVMAKQYAPFQYMFVPNVLVYLCRHLTSISFDAIAEFMEEDDCSRIVKMYRRFIELLGEISSITEYDTKEITRMILSFDDSDTSATEELANDITLSFVDSNTIRKYPKDSNYKYSLIETMYLLMFSNQKKSLKKKLSMCRVISGKKDYVFGTNSIYSWEKEFAGYGVKQALTDWIDMEEELLTRFYEDDDNAEYSFFVMYKKLDSDTMKDSLLFYDYKSCSNYLTEFINEMQNSDNIVDIYVTKTYKENDGKYKFPPINVVFDANFNTNKVFISIVKDDYHEENGVNLYWEDCDFDDTYNKFMRKYHKLRKLMNEAFIELPLPFKKGNVLYDKKTNLMFKLCGIGDWLFFSEEQKNRMGEYYKNGQYHDIVIGQCVDADGILTEEACIMFSYLGLEWAMSYE